MFNVVLYQPEIPPNTGNIMRLCANTGCTLHLIQPLGFDLEDSKLRRAGLDYRDYADVRTHEDLSAYLTQQSPTARLYAISTRGQTAHDQARFHPGDSLLFGPETRGLPREILDSAHACLRLPMRPASRSLNLANAVAITIYEAWRQLDFDGAC